MLTDTLIRSVKPADKPKKYADGGGLFLYVPLTGKRLWRMAYRFNKKSKLLSFGEYPLISLKTARERRDEAKKLLAEGIDPGQHKKTVRAAKLAEEANTFRSVAMEWHETKTLDNTPEHRRRVLYYMEKYLFPSLGKMPIALIEASDILAIVKPLETNSISAAHRAMQICGMVFRYGVVTGKIKHNIVADLRGSLRSKRPIHRAGLTDRKTIGRLLLKLDDFQGHFQIQCALRLMPLFFVRAGELRHAEWAEFDFEDKLWRIPAYRMKMRFPHLVPLAEQAVVILTALKEYTGNGKLLFPSSWRDGKPIGSATMLTAIRHMGYTKQELCVHGFRTMASTLLNEIGYNRDWIERQLAHKERDGVRAAYNSAQYLSERRRMMQEYADFLDELREKARREDA